VRIPLDELAPFRALGLATLFGLGHLRIARPDREEPVVDFARPLVVQKLLVEHPRELREQFDFARRRLRRVDFDLKQTGHGLVLPAGFVCAPRGLQKLGQIDGAHAGIAVQLGP
jgi:hypothetical protein